MQTRQLVTEIDHLEAILQELRRLNANLERQGQGQPQPRPPAPEAPPRTSYTHGRTLQAKGGEVASDEDLDGQWGNPTIRKDPPRWTGQSFAGMPMSEASAEYLESLAGFLDWCAGKADEKNEMTNNGQPRSSYMRRDAARARGWAQRASRRPTRAVVRGSEVAQEPIPGYESDDDIPF